MCACDIPTRVPVKVTEVGIQKAIKKKYNQQTWLDGQNIHHCSGRYAKEDTCPEAQNQLERRLLRPLSC